MVVGLQDNTTVRAMIPCTASVCQPLQEEAITERLAATVVTALAIVNVPTAALDKMASTTVPATGNTCVRHSGLLPMVATGTKPWIVVIRSTTAPPVR